MASCCPPQIEPSVTAAEAGATSPLTGMEVKLDGKIRAYVAEPPESKLGADGKPKGAVIIFHDIFGFNSARTHHIADEIAREGGYLVVEPDFFEDTKFRDPSELLSFSFFNGVSALTSRARFQFPEIERKVREIVMPFVRSKTDGKVGTIGFCWGGWAVTRIAAFPDLVACGVGAHPSVHGQMMQKTGPTMDEMFRQVKVPLLYAPGWNDPASLRDNGYYMKILKENNSASRSILFKDQVHGFANRSDLRVEKNLKAYEKFMYETLNFYHEQLGGDKPSAPAPKL